MYIEPIFTDINDDFNCNTRQAFWLKQADKQPFKSNSIRAKQELLLLGDKTAASVQQVSTRAVSVKTRPPLSRPQTWPSFKTNNVATQGKLGLKHPSPNLAQQVILTKSSRYDVHLVHYIVTISNATSPGSIQSHGMDLIHKGDSTKLMGNIAHLLQRTHSA